MPFRIAVDGKSYDTDALHLDGASGKIYEFLWSKQHSRYLHAPKSQEECDDLFRTMSPESMFFFSVVVEDLPGASAPVDPAVVKRPGPTLEPRYYVDLEVDELAALAKDCGIAQGINSTQDTSLNEEQRRREIWRRILDAFYLGAGWKAANPKVEQAPVATATETAASVTNVIQFPLTDHDELRVIEYCQANLERLRKEQPTIFQIPAAPAPKAVKPAKKSPKKPVKAAVPAPTETPPAAATG